MIQTITEKARSIMVDSQVPCGLRGEAVNTAVELHQRPPNEGQTKRDVRNRYQSPYPTPYEMLNVFGKPSRNTNSNEISYYVPLHHHRQFGCYGSRLIPKLEHQRNVSLRSKPCMMVGDVHDSTTLWRIWDPAFQVVRSQLNVMFVKEGNTRASCL
jgi:hypothetical protein